MSSYREECYSFIQSFFGNSAGAHLFVQPDYHRVNYKNSDGTLAVGRGERIAVVEHPDTVLEGGYRFELWTFLAGADAAFDDIYYTRTAGTLHPRPIGALTALNRSRGDEVDLMANG